MSMQNGGPSLADRPWTYWALIGASVVVAVTVGYGVGTALFGTSDEVEA